MTTEKGKLRKLFEGAETAEYDAFQGPNEGRETRHAAALTAYNELDAALLAAGYAHISEGGRFAGRFRSAGWAKRGDRVTWTGLGLKSSAIEMAAVAEAKRREKIEREAE
jgi:hypothetical protein